jgi:hypothetical protein
MSANMIGRRMRDWRKLLAAAVLLGAFGTVRAQKSDDQGATLDVGASAGVQAQIDPGEMSSRAGSMIADMESMQGRLTTLQQQARESRDIIKLNCVNDKLLQLKQLLNIAEAARVSLSEAISSHNDGDRYHQYTVITVSSEKARALRDEAEACIGEELVFNGRATIDVDAPDIADDPTRTDPFALASFDIERPTYATPFL